MLFINQLHLFTVMTLTGKVELVEKDGDKQGRRAGVELAKAGLLEPNPARQVSTCSDGEKDKLRGPYQGLHRRLRPRRLRADQPSRPEDAGTQKK